MTKNSIIAVLAVVLVSVVALEGAVDGSRKARLLRDGFGLLGVDGRLTSADSNEGSQGEHVGFGMSERWFFKFDSNVDDDRGRISAGLAIELLPSAALEKMVADAKEHPGAAYRLWGNVTRYGNKNFIFPIYFLPVKSVDAPEPKALQEQPKVTTNEPDDVLAIPEQVLAKLKSRPIVRTEQLRKGLELKQDSILVDRTGFIVPKGDGKISFVFDGLGRNVQHVSLELLPCEVLQRASRKQSAELEKLRFKVAGIVTKYNGKNYLLLQRAIRIYNHGNFGR